MIQDLVAGAAGLFACWVLIWALNTLRGERRLRDWLRGELDFELRDKLRRDLQSHPAWKWRDGDSDQRLS